MFNCSITEKSNLMSSLIQYFRNSRISTLNLSDCDIKLWCNQRQFALYFEIEKKDIARSLWNEIHDDKLVASSIKELNLSGLTLTINERNLLLFQELSMLECPSIDKLNISRKEISTSRLPQTCWHLYDILENIPISIAQSVKNLNLDNHCLYQILPASNYQGMKEILIKFENLETLSFAKTLFFPYGSGKEEVLNTCIEMLPKLTEINLSSCYIPKDVGLGLCKNIKNKVKRGFQIRIRIYGTSGEGLKKLLSLLSLSKYVYYKMDQDENVVTVEKV